MASVRLVSVPWDSGHHGRRMGAGPPALLEAGLPDRLRGAGLDVDHVLVEPDAPFPTELATTFELARVLSGTVADALRDGRRPLVLSGGCGSAAGTVAGLGAADVGAVWFDAHGDLNTPETTTSGFVDGTAAATLVGRCWAALARSIPGFAPLAPERMVFVGVRDLDPPEEAWLKASGAGRVDVAAFRSGAPGSTAVVDDREADARAEAALGPALDRLWAAGVRRAYLHVDLDVLDPEVARVNPFQAPDGLTLEELLAAIRLIGGRLGVAGGALTSLDPSADPGGEGVEAALEVTACASRVLS